MIETRSKAIEFYDAINGDINVLVGLTDTEFAVIIGRIKNNTGRRLPKDKTYNNVDISQVVDLLWYCDCALHINNWSSVWWVLKKRRDD